MSIDECPECSSNDLVGFNDTEPARQQCRDCGTKVEPCRTEGCDGIRELVASDYMRKWECPVCNKYTLEE